MSVAQKTSIVLVHGGFVDGSGWEGVYKILKDRLRAQLYDVGVDPAAIVRHTSPHTVA